ncbi:hypothetical protein ACQP04_11840 [Pseudonocardia halophobica]|uniref:hypothetical protein n=1 Tax=Pseudonocardia halophobica TaxID=29401 RepID=UPI003D8ECE4F
MYPSRPRTPPSTPPVCAGGLLLGLPAAVGAQVVAWACDPADVAVGGLALAALAAGLAATATSTGGAVVAGTVGWAVYDGFAAHRLGELHAGAADVRALLVVVGAALVFRAPAAVLRVHRAGPGRVLTVLGHGAHRPLLGPASSVVAGAGPGARDAPPQEDPCTRFPSSSSTSTPTAPRPSSSTR